VERWVGGGRHTGSGMPAATHGISCFFISGTPTTDIYTLSLHDALPICVGRAFRIDAKKISVRGNRCDRRDQPSRRRNGAYGSVRSGEHTAELQSRRVLV